MYPGFQAGAILTVQVVSLQEFLESDRPSTEEIVGTILVVEKNS